VLGRNIMRTDWLETGMFRMYEEESGPAKFVTVCKGCIRPLSCMWPPERLVLYLFHPFCETYYYSIHNLHSLLVFCVHCSSKNIPRYVLRVPLCIRPRNVLNQWWEENWFTRNVFVVNFSPRTPPYYSSVFCFAFCNCYKRRGRQMRNGHDNYHFRDRGES
jgi:hypothetical protein